MGRDLLPDAATAAATFDGRELLLELDATGRVHQAHSDPEAPPFSTLALRYLVAELLPIVESEATWTAGPEPTGLGAAHSYYTLTHADADTAPTLELRRERLTYDRLEALTSDDIDEHRLALSGEATASLDPSGTLRSLDSSEHLALTGATTYVADTAATLVLVRTEDVPARDASARLAHLTAQRFDRPPKDPGTQERLLMNRVAGLTGDQLLADLAAYGSGGLLPDHSRWLWRATGLLLLEPGLAADLADTFADGNATHRELVLDLLAAAGTAQAQLAMRDLLSEPAHQAAAGFPLQLQRLSTLRNPEPATVDLVRGLFDDHHAAHGNHWAAGYALGSTAGALYDADPAAALEAAAPLVEALASVSDATDRRHLLASLGNAALPEHAAAVRAHADDASPHVQAATARALRDLDDQASVDALHGLLADPSVAVQRAALGALQSRAGAVEDILGRVADGVIHRANFESVTKLLLKAPATPNAAPALHAMLATVNLQPALRAQLAELQAVLQSP